jgi:hypothetical protein
MASSVLVARTKPEGMEYLLRAAPVAWTDVSDLAQHFQTVRDATRAALRLPGRFRAFALPVHGELN